MTFVRPTVATAITQPLTGAMLALGLFCAISLITLSVAVAAITGVTLVSSREISALGVGVVYGAIAVFIIGCEVFVAGLATLFIGLPLGIVTSLLMRQTRPIAVQLIAFFIVGVLSASATIAVAMLALDTNDSGSEAIVGGLGSPFGMVLIIITGLCSAAAWQLTTLIARRQDTRRRLLLAQPAPAIARGLAIEVLS